jgi:hypothetical protein
MKHTPGPWKYSVTHPLSGSAWFVVVDRNGSGPIMDVGGHEKNGQIAEAKYLITDPQEIEANARLIAAAPELLEALELLLADAEGLYKATGGMFTDERFPFVTARAAIAKATNDPQNA